MRRFLTLVACIAAFPLAGCCGSATQTVPVTGSSFAAQDACAPAAQAVTVQTAAPTGVELTVGPREHARSFLEIPGNVVECGGVAVGELVGTAGRFLKCLGGKLVPEPTPTQRFVYGPLVQQQYVLAPQAQPSCVAPASHCAGGCCAVAQR